MEQPNEAFDAAMDERHALRAKDVPAETEAELATSVVEAPNPVGVPVRSRTTPMTLNIFGEIPLPPPMA